MAELFKVNAPVRKPLFEGVQGENEARSIQFDITPWVEELGDGAVTATAKRSQDSQPYPVTVTKDGTTVTWKPTSTDTAFAGVGSFQLEYTVDDVLAKTCIWSTMVAPSLGPAGDPPDPIPDYIDEMREIAADAIQAAQDADESADDAQAEVYEAEAWATGTKNGTPVPSTADQYENNSKYYSEESYKNAEAWAVGQRGGVDVPSTDPAYENNAKYWAGQAEDLKDATQAIVDEARADVFEAMDGLHEETTAGSALQLISSNYTEDQSPYLFRKSGGGKSIGNREIDKIVGGSIAWNQLVGSVLGQSGSFSANGLTWTIDETNHTVTINGTSTARTSIVDYNADKVIKDHVYLCASIIGLTMHAPRSGWMLSSDASASKPNVQIRKASGNGTDTGVRFECMTVGTTFNNVKFTPQVIDLTQMFGTSIADKLYQMEQANAGSGVALFRSWFPKDYYAYNTGELMSVKTSAHEMVGFNQWDEQWEVGGMNSQTGENTAETDRIRSKNFIPVLPSTSYRIRANQGGCAVVFFDSDKTRIDAIAIGMANGGTTFTTQANCRYIRFNTYSNYGNTYNHDICINLSSDRNGEYQPYTKHTYALDDVELRGVPKLVDDEIQYDGDTYEADGTVTRKYGVVDLGSLTWTYSSGKGGYFYTNLTQRKLATTVMCGKYPYVGIRHGGDYTDDKIIASEGNTNTYIDIRDTAYGTDATAFKTAMSGVYLVYEKAAPTTETADPFTSPQIVDAYGTERYVDERTVAVPVGHVTKYPDNLREKLDGLPWDFSTLIAPTEKAYTATRNYTTGSLLIVNNILYKVTANIANGGTITPNTNCTATTLAEVISAL